MSAEPRATPRDLVDEIVAGWRGEMPEVPGLTMELVKRITLLYGRVAAVTGPVLERQGLTKAEYEVLAMLRRDGPPCRMRPNELSAGLLLSSGGTTNVLHRLVAAGLVVRESDPDDRRGSAVRLTDAGVAKAEAAVREVTDAQTAMLSALPEPEAREHADRLRDLLAALSGVRG